MTVSEKTARTFDRTAARLTSSVLAGALLAASLSAVPVAAASAGSQVTADNIEQTDVPTAVKEYSAQSSDVTSLDLDESEVTIIGASWDGADPHLEMRIRDDDGWSSWQPLPAEDEGGPDEQSAEGKQARSFAQGIDGETQGVPVVDAAEVEVRSSTTHLGATDITIRTVTTEVTDEDADVAAEAEPSPSPTVAPGEGVDAQVYHNGLKADIVTRREWGADESLVRCEPDSTAGAKGVFLHHTAGSNSYTRSQAPAIIRGYLSYHTQSRGWCDLGYNFLVDKYGVIYEGRAGSIDRAITGAHAAGFNSSTIGVSVLGTYGTAAPSTAAQNSVKRVIAWKANQYGFAPTGKMTLTSGGGSTSRYPAGRSVSLNVVSGHRDTSYTECPGNSFYSQLGSIRSGAKALQSSVGGGIATGGAIGAYYREHMDLTGAPVATMKALSNPDGWYQHFANGTVYWSSATGAHFNTGGIRTAYAALGYEKGILGFPSSDEIRFKYRSNAVYQTFRNGMITYSSTTKGQPLSHGMLGRWKALGWERSRLGLPTSGEFASAGKTRQNFEGGYMTYKTGEGVKVYYR
ncbi:N-acetylmuramoyl-L-alanine amidase [Brevibacterium sp.]|uniref:N-acetylmuramoyl-L-alanine amidase n=1 Tax=Brevibacterium sp. TaxID=1701 RepID=UPI0028110C2B|nr:N-acetylmuramoyl-L-alanine amidase [Brevibacterium sp.]